MDIGSIISIFVCTFNSKPLKICVRGSNKKNKTTNASELFSAEAEFLSALDNVLYWY